MITFIRVTNLLVTFSLFVSFLLFVQCSSPSQSEIPLTPAVSKTLVQPRDTIARNEPDTVTTVTTSLTKADAATMLARKQVPILCYHQLRNWRASDSKSAKTYIVEEENFREQIKMLADSGYQTILPDQLHDYLVYGRPLPEKPIMLTFDDTNLDHFTVAAPELEKYGFRGVFFIMTVSLGRPNYMQKTQVKALSDAGHIIGSHTWDHQNVKKYTPQDWVTQIGKPVKQLEQITGKPVLYFAYPFGLWNEQAVQGIKQRNFKAAFQLATARDATEPLYTIRRIIASGYDSPKELHASIERSF
ncbi:polysaccharide deacetylase family protein [Pontibacter sp. H259]|uniref:polysaccharide deacetylase family protein n=1 Tax=Pontibacter sp. H259 TaxID=3133421 RepID=UPI0030C3C76B